MSQSWRFVEEENQDNIVQGVILPRKAHKSREKMELHSSLEEFWHLTQSHVQKIHEAIYKGVQYLGKKGNICTM